MVSCYDVANYFLAKQDDESGEIISNLKLQKLVYYAQGFNLAINDEPLFPEIVEAWMHGPVIPDLYHFYKDYGSERIPPPVDFDFSVLNDDTKELLDDIFCVYGQYSAWKLRNITHNEPPWANANRSGQKTISHDAMKEYFQTQLN